MQAHGSFDLWVDNQVLLARISGAWNEEETRLYFKQIKEVTQPIIHRPWAMLLHLNSWQLGTPEAERVTKEIVYWIAQHGLARIAEIYSPSVMIQLEIDRLVQEAPDEIERRHFLEEEKAFAWLASQGFPVQLAQLINR